jgi:hypothetical protein
MSNMRIKAPPVQAPAAASPAPATKKTPSGAKAGQVSAKAGAGSPVPANQALPTPKINLETWAAKVKADQKVVADDVKTPNVNWTKFTKDSQTLQADLLALSNVQLAEGNAAVGSTQLSTLFGSSPKGVPGPGDVLKSARSQNSSTPDATAALSAVAQNNGAFLKNNITSTSTLPSAFNVRLYGEHGNPVDVNVPLSSLPKSASWADVYRQAISTQQDKATTATGVTQSPLNMITGKPQTVANSPFSAASVQSIANKVQDKKGLAVVEFVNTGVPGSRGPSPLSSNNPGVMKAMASAVKGNYLQNVSTSDNYASGQDVQNSSTSSKVQLANGDSLSASKNVWYFTPANGKPTALPLYGSTITGVDAKTKNIMLAMPSSQTTVSLPATVFAALSARIVSTESP